MKPVVVGVWGTSHWVLDLIGRSAVWCLHANAYPKDDDLYSIIGSAIVGAVFGVALGFTFAVHSHDLSPVAGTAIGSLMGTCTGICCGAIVQCVDDFIRHALHSLDQQ